MILIVDVSIVYLLSGVFPDFNRVHRSVSQFVLWALPFAQYAFKMTQMFKSWRMRKGKSNVS